MMELPVRLGFWGSDSRQQLPGASIVTCEQQCRSAAATLVGSVGPQNVCTVTLPKAPWPLYPSFPTLSYSHGGGMDRRTSCASSIWKRSSTNANASGEGYTTEQLWEEYFADPSQWWDNRADKRNYKSHNFKHKVTRKTLWVDGWSTPPWAKAMLKLGTPGKMQPLGYHSQGSQDTARSNRAPKNSSGKGTPRPISMRELRQFVQGDHTRMQMQSAGATSEAISILKNHLQQGITIDSYMYVEALQRCFKEKDLLSAKQVHDCIRKSGMEQNIYVANNLLRVYIRCHRLQDARQVFDKLVKKTVISWTIMIGGYAQHDSVEDAIEVFNQMCQKGPKPNEITYLTILKSCVSPAALKWAKDVHARIRHTVFESDVRVGTALVKMYAKCGSIKEARGVFEKLANRDLITWNVMIGGLAEHGYGYEAYQHFLKMQSSGFVPDEYTYVSILNPGASVGASEWVKEVHMQALKAGLESNLRVGSALVHMYAMSGSIDDARMVFNRMKDRNVITWNVMIGGLAQHGCGHEAYQHFLKMQRAGFIPDEYTYVSILHPCASAGALEWVKEVHMQARNAGLESNLRVGSALVHMYAKSGSIDDARIVFNRMQDRDVITWNLMIGGLAEHGCGHEAHQHFLEMQSAGFVPDECTYVSILNPCASAGALEWVKEVHIQALKAGLKSNLRVGSALVHMYAKSGSIDDARIVFNRMEDRDVITWNVMIGGLAEHGCGIEALQLYEQMGEEGVRPDGVTFCASLSACSHAGLVDEGHRLFLAMTQDYGIEPTVVHYTCLVDLLGRAGRLEEAKLFIQNMPIAADGATWGALLGACRTYSNVELAKLAGQELLTLEPKNASVYVLLSNIYAAAGKWDQVSLVRNLMQERGIHKEPGCSWIEVDKKIHHFVVGDTSHPEAKDIYAELNILAKKMKAEGYIPDTQLVLHNIDEEEKELALCSHSEKLAIAYGLMRTAPGKPIRIYKNLRVCSDCHTATKFISKVTGREIVARDANRFHHFKEGICSCGDYW